MDKNQILKSNIKQLNKHFNKIKRIKNVCCHDCENCVTCEDCDDCINCKDCKDCFLCVDCKNCKNCYECKNCYNCTNDCKFCLLCSNIYYSEYMILNVQFTKEEYLEKIKELD